MLTRTLIVSVLTLSLLLIPQGVVAQSVDELFERGNTAQSERRYEEAERTWRRILEIDPNNADAYIGLGIALRNQGKLEEAISAYGRAIELNPQYADAYVGLGLALYNQGKLEEAISAYGRAIELNPQYADAYIGLGIALKDQGKLEEAISAYGRAIELNPQDAIAYIGLGIALRNQGKLEEAISAYGRAIELNPQSAIAYNNLGNALRNQGKLEEAISAYGRAIELNPQSAIAYNNLGNALKDQGKLEEAISAYGRAIELNPQYADAYNNLGIALQQQGKLEEAISAYRTALRLPDNTRATPSTTHTLAHNALGYALQQQGKLEEAISQYQAAIQIDPEFPQARTNLAEAQRLLALRSNPLPPQRTERLPSLDENPRLPQQRAVVLIITATPTGAKYGTGWVIQRDGDTTLIATNRHVVSDDNQRPSDSIQIELYSQNPPEQRLRFDAQIRHITSPTDLLDLAILEVRNLPEDIQPLPLARSPVPMDADVRIVGHPSTGTPWTWQRGYIANITPNSDQQNLLIGGTNLAVGNSGSPLIYDDKVVGLVVRISNQQAAASSETEGDTIDGFSFAYPLQVLEQQVNYRY
ncbi:serine protease [Oxynema aestuarii]|uniref:Tetratricopeptide repeat protein n=1 Tax=Oxynema aestuarii AP17 TaxID=2064643 RepID=A0A6H1TZ99_9CYAN|nr:serine protease [Oxynema aestuarii]QIZ71914.1 tetratricopeptide repeat protein [Oxynema aestuarii AP17]